MESQSFNWGRTKQLSVIQVFFAFALPSVFAFCGFRLLLPSLVADGVPVLVAWPVVASFMLLVLVSVAMFFLHSEAKQLNIRLGDRMCLKTLNARQWRCYTIIMMAGLLLASGANLLVAPFMEIFNLSVPEYMPFFLDPSINVLDADPEQISPGFPVKGKFYLLPLFLAALLLNILAEELYFRAWLLPKMAKYGRASWVLSGLLFALYHTFQFWLFPTILVGSLVWAFVIYYSRSIYPALLGHFVGNFLISFAGFFYLVLK